MVSNLTLNSNLQPIKDSAYYKKEETEPSLWFNKPQIIHDKGFLKKITNPEALKALVSVNGGMNTSSYIFAAEQIRIVENCHTCGYLRRDYCFGPERTQSGNVRMACRCVNTDCKNYMIHRNEEIDDFELRTYDSKDLSCVDEYGYSDFLKRATKIYENINSNLGIMSEAPSHICFDIGKKEEQGEPFDLISKVDKEKNIYESTQDELTEPLEISDKPENSEECLNAKELNTADLNVFNYFKGCTQEEIITADPSENFFVDAGPGTGKTYTLINKINYMVTKQGVEADGILVLCFTNAAVDEIKTRLREFVDQGADRSLINVDVRTFHSFAWWLIGQANDLFVDLGWTRIDMRGLTYEGSLVKAGVVMSKYGDSVVGNWEYFVVDEVQDLTNTLGHFVLKTVNACLLNDCGVTVLGDACQAIYDYSQESLYEQFKSSEFYRALFRKMQGKSKFVFLDGNHRQDAELAILTDKFRSAILEGDVTQMNTVTNDLLINETTKIPSKFKIDAQSLDQLRHAGNMSLLFRNNGQTLKMSSDLRKLGIPHSLNVKETPNNYSVWIANVFSNYKSKFISEKDFIELYENCAEKNGAEVWSRLQKLLHTDNDVLNVRELLDAISLNQIDDTLLRTSNTKELIVSNIHRAKGREYDCVLVDQNFAEQLSLESPVEEYKTLYVAITRPKEKLYFAPLQAKNRLKKIKIFASNRTRWGKTKSQKISSLELDSSKDLGCDIFSNIPSERMNQILIGDAISFVRHIKNNHIEYEIIHENTEACIGVVTEDCNYISDLMSYMKIDNTSLIEMPSRIDDFYVSGIYSQVVDSEYLEMHPDVKDNAPNGVWKWIELVGVGHATYDIY